MINCYEIEICPLCKTKLEYLSTTRYNVYRCYLCNYRVTYFTNEVYQAIFLSKYRIFNRSNSDKSSINNHIPEHIAFLPKIFVDRNTDCSKLDNNIEKLLLFT